MDAGFAPFTSNPAPAPPVALYLLMAAVIAIAVPVLLEGRAGRPPRTPPLAGA